MKKTQKQLEITPQNQEEICKCGHDRFWHNEVGCVIIEEPHDMPNCPCKKFTPKTGKYGDKGRPKNHSSTEAEKLDEMPDYETTSQDAPFDNLCMQVSEGTQNQKGCGEVEVETAILSNGKRITERYKCGTRASKFNQIYLCPKCRGEKEK